ncbi:phage tail protein [Enterobacter sp. 166D1]|uniref:phage tail fiber protein n=1 Tax=Enterobacter TaxID=547 RepID=UPI002A82F1CD|nr:phage tail protein [Enterobacter sp. 166D1]
MSAGTITLTNGSAVVSGSGTSFATELAAGDFIVSTVGGVSYTLPVKSVESNAQLTLVSNFTGPTQSGAAWSAVPRVAMNMVTAALVAQSAEALRGLNYDKQNWQQVYSAAGNITVKLPDGTTFTGPSWKYLSDNMATKSGGAVPVNQGGTGSTTAAGARTNLGLGSSSIYDVGISSGQVMQVGAFGLGKNADISTGVTQLHVGDPSSNITRFSYVPSSVAIGFLPSQWRAGFEIKSTGATGFQLWASSYGTKPRAAIRIADSSGSNGYTDFAEFYTTVNTTKASDGTLKAASPVARIVKSREETERADVAEDGFTWCGCGAANMEAEGIALSRLDIGVYVLSGSAGLASEGWQLLPPMDPGGMGELGVVEAEKTDNGELTIRLFKRKYMLGNEGDIVKTKGEPIDVPANSWIDVRLDMPENSLWNQRQKEAMAKETQEPAS